MSLFMPEDQKRRLIAYLVEGNTLEDLAEMYLDKLPRFDLDELIKEVEVYDHDRTEYEKDQQT